MVSGSNWQRHTPAAAGRVPGVRSERHGTEMPLRGALHHGCTSNNSCLAISTQNAGGMGHCLAGGVDQTMTMLLCG